MAKPTNPALYNRVKAEAKRKFDVYPSAYANAWLVKTYKKRGGGYSGKDPRKGADGMYVYREGGHLSNIQKQMAEEYARGGKSPAWQRKEGKNPSGGLNEAGRKSYERQNPGSNLKAPQPGGGKRRNSFCARMKGMKKKLTSAKTANDPNSRINKSLRKWNCKHGCK